ncbi:MAG: sterol desaturase family protein [Bdellovibrionia bacterium]
MNFLVTQAVWTVLIFFLMEGVAWFLHQYVMHGWGWFLHKSHHEVKTESSGSFELNDFYVIPFMILNVLGFYFCVRLAPELLFLPMGSTLYGAFYFLFHEVIVHQRIRNRIGAKTKNAYLIRLIRAHHIHHSVHAQHGCESFSFLYADPKYALKKAQSASEAFN